MSLIEDKIPRMAVSCPTEEIVHSHVVQRRARAETGDMTPQSVLVVISTHDHSHRVPANKRPNTSLHKQVTGHDAFIFGVDGVFERRRDGGR